ncbi:ISAs1 family transposase [Xylanimonas sp. McL0601]|uniref:ISAs1 family transposase n=1 Tax=Xylanimonas sp. McL0601 TaxID=3414739 RepID=UPI003CEF90AC
MVDPRRREGRRYPLAGVLTLTVCAVLAGAKTLTEISEWLAAAPARVVHDAGLTGSRRPSETTVRRLLGRVEPGVLDQVVGAWLATRHVPAPGARRVLAVDGKTIRGARTRTGGKTRQAHVVAALDHATGTVIGQVQVAGKDGGADSEIGAIPRLLDRFDLAGVLVTADALHTQRAHAAWLTGRGGHYVMTVKGNQPTLLATLKALPWPHVPDIDVTRGKGHGRLETRILRAVIPHTPIDFPGAKQALRLIRRVKKGGRWRVETVHLITSLDYDQTTAAELADAIRGHWGIENRLHWVRDVTFDEDRHQARTGHLPAVLATIRNLAISVLRLAGHTNIAAALRALARDPAQAFALVR